MSELPEPLRSMFGMMHGNQGSWVNVNKLSSEDLLKKKNLDSQIRKMASEMKLLQDKLGLVKAQIKVARTEFWDGLYRTYNLPSDLNYRIDDEGNVLKHVPAAPAEGA